MTMAYITQVNFSDLVTGGSDTTLSKNYTWKITLGGGNGFTVKWMYLGKLDRRLKLFLASSKPSASDFSQLLSRYPGLSCKRELRLGGNSIQATIQKLNDINLSLNSSCPM